MSWVWQERLYAPKSTTWISWEACQEARQKCFAAYHAANDNEKKPLLRDALVLAFFTLQPVRPSLRRLAHSPVSYLTPCAPWLCKSPIVSAS